MRQKPNTPTRKRQHNNEDVEDSNLKNNKRRRKKDDNQKQVHPFLWEGWKEIYIAGTSQQVYDSIHSINYDFNHLADALFGYLNPLDSHEKHVCVFGITEQNFPIMVVAVTSHNSTPTTQVIVGEEVVDMQEMKMKWVRKECDLYPLLPPPPLKSIVHFLQCNQRRSAKKNVLLSDCHFRKYEMAFPFFANQEDAHLRIYKFYPQNCELTVEITPHINSHYSRVQDVFSFASWIKSVYVPVFVENSQFNRKVVVSEVGQLRFLSFGDTPDKGFCQLQGQIRMLEDGSYDFSYRSGYSDVMATGGIAFLKALNFSKTINEIFSTAKLLFVGLGTGALPTIFRRHFPEASLDVIEIDPLVVKVAKEYFGFQSDLDTVQLFVKDVRHYLEDDSVYRQGSYDAIFFDIAHEDGLPTQLITPSFMQKMASLLKPSTGVMVSNVFKSFEQKTFNRVLKRFRNTFQSLHSLAVEECESNKIFVAYNRSSAVPPDQLVTLGKEITDNVTFDYNFITCLQTGVHKGEYTI